MSKIPPFKKPPGINYAERKYLEMLRYPAPCYPAEVQEIINDVLWLAQERIKERFDYAAAHPGELVSDLTGGYFLFEPKEKTQVDNKLAFLSELKGLLEKYGAELGDSGMYEIEGMEVTFDNGDRIRYKYCTINALNVMNYEKEYV